MAKFRPGQLVKLDPRRHGPGNGVLAWFPIQTDESDFIVIKSGMIGMYIGERQDRRPEQPGDEVYKKYVFLFEDKRVLMRMSSLVAVEPEEQ